MNSHSPRLSIRHQKEVQSTERVLLVLSQERQSEGGQGEGLQLCVEMMSEIAFPVT